MGEHGLADGIKFMAIEIVDNIDRERRNAILNICWELPALIVEHEDVTLCWVQGSERETLMYSGNEVATIETHIDGCNYSVSYEILVSREELEDMIAKHKAEKDI